MNMLRRNALIIALATLSATAAVSLAQNAYQPAPNDPQSNNPSMPMQSQPAPIERGGRYPDAYNTYVSNLAPGQSVAATAGTASAQPAAGIVLRVGQNSSVRAVAVGNGNTELRVEHGIANISVHDPLNHAQILVDLPGGQTSLIKDGFYTFNADTNTIRVLKGEALTYPGANTNQKPLKIKEDHAVVFNGPNIRSFEFDPFEARADLIPYSPRPGGPSGYYGYGPEYGGGYPYPYYGCSYYYGCPYNYYPYGFGFYGGFGFRDGGFRGGGGRR
jgi:hypothetical protein